MTTLDDYVKNLLSKKHSQEGNPLMSAVSPESPASWEVVKGVREQKTPDTLKGKTNSEAVVLRQEKETGFLNSKYNWWTEKPHAVKAMPIGDYRLSSLQRPVCAEDPVIDLYPTYYGDASLPTPKVGTVITVDYKNREMPGLRYGNGIINTVTKTNISIFGDCVVSKQCAPESPSVTLRKQGGIINGQIVLPNGPPIVGAPSGPNRTPTPVTGGQAPSTGSVPSQAACNVVGRPGGNGPYSGLPSSGPSGPAVPLQTSPQRCSPAKPNYPCLPIPVKVTPPASVASLYPPKGWNQSSGFGPRNPGGGASKIHKGIDYACYFGTPVLAALDGVCEVRTKGTGINTGFGRYIIIKHTGYKGQGPTGRLGQTFYTLYAHLDPDSTKGMHGKTVKKGDQIALVGNTGNRVPKTPPKYGAHLHFEVGTRKLGSRVDPDVWFFPKEFIVRP